ncbi:hypothetical protein TUZN_0641 [Thermoproteus uzoniensis 768-20]|uniref:Uncharacterized protein n=1 Tax=Thermoproteus uzoniensis (strain 768-20) TaxID=999630 RepID=F2L477_THEU7|nr:hypothetical protein [Thermoproteus uzoniensis]AEA12133.1 hypothetical protein TUZN_0641 [Thermoproteus uzoniensis 768-20]
MDLYIVSAAVSLAVAAAIAGAFLTHVGVQAGAPRCSDCVFYVEGPAALVQTNGSAYLVRGPVLANSSIMAQYAWAYGPDGRPLRPGEELVCPVLMRVEVVDGIAYASCVGR